MLCGKPPPSTSGKRCCCLCGKAAPSTLGMEIQVLRLQLKVPKASAPVTGLCIAQDIWQPLTGGGSIVPNSHPGSLNASTSRM